MINSFPLLVWRESVCMGDDCLAPHEVVLSIHRDESLRQLLDRLLTASYLPDVKGKATWILQVGTRSGGRPLCLIAHCWPQPQFLVDPDLPVRSYIGPESKPHLQFKYWLYAAPDSVLNNLVLGLPVINENGRQYGRKEPDRMYGQKAQDIPVSFTTRTSFTA